MRYVLDRLLRRKLPNCSYSAIAPNLGEEPSFRIGCQCYWAFHRSFSGMVYRLLSK
ncbi:MAG: hypothetical protein LUD00_08575 [Prevotellaceae bacterium]|nr:hypothetical protein [Prevotellaceae bacterium]